MSRIAELADDFDGSLKLDGASQIEADDVAFFNERDFDRLAKKGAEKLETDTRNFEERVRDFSKTPLFMNNLDDAADADGENLELDAIRALQFEGTKVEVVQGFKDRGNEMVHEKKWRDAKEFYSKAIAVLTDISDHQWERGQDPELDAKQQKILEEQCYTNRALCNLELKNYRSTTTDCASALRLNPKNAKAHYRSAKALLALNKTTEASNILLKGLQLDHGNRDMKQLYEIVRSQKQIADSKTRKREVEKSKKEREDFTLKAALASRNIRVKGSANAPDLEDARIHLSPNPMDAKSTLVFPVVFLYPMHAQSDMVKQIAEKDPIIDHLSYLFPLPWDTEQVYRVDSVECHMDSTSGGMVKIKEKETLVHALRMEETQVIVDGLVRIHVVPRSLSQQWEVERNKRKTGA